MTPAAVARLAAPAHGPGHRIARAPGRPEDADLRPGVPSRLEAFEAAEIALDSEPAPNPGLEPFQEKARAIARAVKNPEERAQVDKVIRTARSPRRIALHLEERARISFCISHLTPRDHA
jgi:hypothetical protein